METGTTSSLPGSGLLFLARRRSRSATCSLVCGRSAAGEEDTGPPPEPPLPAVRPLLCAGRQGPNGARCPFVGGPDCQLSLLLLSSLKNGASVLSQQPLNKMCP